ncbi:MAG: LURP-one-related family protein [Chloroflexota bacterium]
MRYVMREKLLAFGDDYIIKNEHGDAVFYVDGRAFSIGDKLAFKDMSGQELAFIKQKLLSFGPTYEIYREGDLVAVVKKALFTLFRARFSVDVPGPDDLEAQGNFFEHEYTFSRHGQTVAQVSKRWFSFRDTYGIEIADGEDDILILASAVVIDQVMHEDSKKDDD